MWIHSYANDALLILSNDIKNIPTENDLYIESSDWHSQVHLAFLFTFNDISNEIHWNWANWPNSTIKFIHWSNCGRKKCNLKVHTHVVYVYHIKTVISLKIKSTQIFSGFNVNCVLWNSKWTHCGEPIQILSNLFQHHHRLALIQLNLIAFYCILFLHEC